MCTHSNFLFLINNICYYLLCGGHPKWIWISILSHLVLMTNDVNSLFKSLWALVLLFEEMSIAFCFISLSLFVLFSHKSSIDILGTILKCLWWVLSLSIVLSRFNHDCSFDCWVLFHFTHITGLFFFHSLTNG